MTRAGSYYVAVFSGPRAAFLDLLEESCKRQSSSFGWSWLAAGWSAGPLAASSPPRRGLRQVEIDGERRPGVCWLRDGLPPTLRGGKRKGWGQRVPCSSSSCHRLLSRIVVHRDNEGLALVPGTNHVLLFTVLWGGVLTIPLAVVIVILSI